jgi:hypothetical protein
MSTNPPCPNSGTSRPVLALARSTSCVGDDSGRRLRVARPIGHAPARPPSAQTSDWRR